MAIHASFDPSGVGLSNGHLFGMPHTAENARVVIIPVPWAATVSYGAGAEAGPEAVLAASPQLDFHVPDFPEVWRAGFFLLPIPDAIRQLHSQTRPRTRELIRMLEGGASPAANHVRELQNHINAASSVVRTWVQREADRWLAKGKLVAVLGGEHSCPLGLLHAIAAKHGNFGILQVDAHADLRNAYMGLDESHACIMFNALKIREVERLTQVGIRDFAHTEAEAVANSGGRALMYADQHLRRRMFAGETWDALCAEIVATLPGKVYVSFDIDGLLPYLCPGTGTPVPGGLEFAEATHLLRKVRESGRTLIGFDLCEVSPADGSDWDANVGARMLWELCVGLVLGNDREAPNPIM